MSVFRKLADNGYTQLLYELAGYQAFDPDTVMAQEAKSLESQNSDNTTAIDDILEAYENGDLEKFYFSKLTSGQLIKAFKFNNIMPINIKIN